MTRKRTLSHTNLSVEVVTFEEAKTIVIRNKNWRVQEKKLYVIIENFLGINRTVILNLN